MRCLAIVSLIVALTACNKKKDQAPEGTGAPPPAPAPAAGSAQPAAPAPPPDDYVAAFTQFKDRICACADKPCVEKVQAELKAYGDAHPRAALDLAPEDARHALAIGEELNACVAKASGSGSGSH